MSDDNCSSYSETKTSDRTSGKKKAVPPRPPFKTCFVLRQELGRSSVTQSYGKEKVPVVTSKFYAAHDAHPRQRCNLEKSEQFSEMQYQTPKEKFQKPVLESHRYGWYSQPLMEIDKADRRLHFATCLSDMVKTQCLINRSD